MTARRSDSPEGWKARPGNLTSFCFSEFIS
jgi:hypothetical protein